MFGSNIYQIEKVNKQYEKLELFQQSFTTLPP